MHAVLCQVFSPFNSFHIFCEAILTEQGLTAGKISQHKKKRLPAERRKWIDLDEWFFVKFLLVLLL